MIDTEVSFTSLCYISEDFDGSIWLNRLADIEGGKLQQPFKSGRLDNYFENRDRLYRNVCGIGLLSPIVTTPILIMFNLIMSRMSTLCVLSLQKRTHWRIWLSN